MFTGLLWRPKQDLNLVWLNSFSLSLYGNRINRLLRCPKVAYVLERRQLLTAAPFRLSLFLTPWALGRKLPPSLAQSVKQRTSNNNISYSRLIYRSKKKNHPQGMVFFLAPQTGLEPVTLRLTAACSTDWAIRAKMLASTYFPGQPPAKYLRRKRA